MPQQSVRGTKWPLLQKERWVFDPSNGWLHEYNYRGVDQFSMLALAQDFARNGIANDLTYEQGDTATLVVQDSTLQFPIDRWELVNNQERPDLFTHPTLLSLDDSIISAMRQAIENQQSSTDAFSGGVLEPYQNTYVQRLYSNYLRGATEFLRDSYVLRHTTNAPNRWRLNIADFGVDFIYTPAELLTEVQNSALWAFPMPPRLAFKIANFPAPAFVANYLWGWLKQGSTEATAANNRVDISQEYILAQWSTDEYPPF